MSYDINEMDFRLNQMKGVRRRSWLIVMSGMSQMSSVNGASGTSQVSGVSG